ncbi:unnamed protein product, partial [Brassica rapa subsp. trilocularis]
FLRQKIEITFIVFQNLIATIPFHHLSPNLVQLRETMVKSKSKKKGNLNSQPSSSQIDNRELQCGEGNVTASMSKLRCGEDDMTASRSELRCGETRRRTGHASIVEKKTTSSRGVKVSFIYFSTKSSILTFTYYNFTSFLYQNLSEI